MTSREFQQWQSWHGARFPNWAAWLKNLGRQDSAVKQADVLSAMFEALADVGIDDAKEASKRLACGDEPEIDQFDQHARTVRAVARRLRGGRNQEYYGRIKVIDGEPTYRCPDCTDSGIRVVFHPETIRAARKDPESLVSGKCVAYRIAVACLCAKGCRIKEGGMRQFDNSMIEVKDNLNWKQKITDMIDAVGATCGKGPYDFGDYGK